MEEGQPHQQDHSHSHQHQHGDHQQHAQARPFEINNRYIFAGLFIAILLLAVFARTGLTGSQGLFEPDGFFYYAVVTSTLAHHLSEPQYLPLSGFPTHNFIGEAPGLPYVTVIFYELLSWSGATALAVMRWLPVLVGVVEVILAYFIAKELSNSRLCGLLAMAFLAVSAGNIARTAALVYRGDTFIGIPIMLAVLILLKGLKQTDIRKQVAFGLLGAFVLSLGGLVWNGSPFIIVIYAMSLALLMLYAFISWKPELARATFVFIITLFALYLLQSIYLALHGIRVGLTLEGTQFLAFYIPLLLGAGITYWIIRRGRVGVLHSAGGRALFAAVVAIILAVVVAVAFSGYINQIATASGVSPAVVNGTSAQNIAYAVGSTTQELQKPSFSFLYASFILELYLMPIGIVLFLLFNRRFDGRDHEGKQILTSAFIVLAVYLLVTLYLQYNAIRYNSLLSIPMALLAAYAVYAIIQFFSPRSIVRPGLKYLFAIGVIVAMIALYLVWLHNIIAAGVGLHDAFYITEAVLMVLFMAILVACSVLPVARNRPLSLKPIVLVAAMMVILYCATFCLVESFSSSQADGINPAFLTAMTWLKNNTPANATVLALWPDGSVVEGWGNRTSYMDSVGGENPDRIYYFARYLENTTPDTQYLYSIGKPEYLLARQYWLTELQGLVAEGVPENGSAYSFTVLSTTRAPEENATNQLYFFGNGNYNVTLVGRKPAANSTSKLGNYSAYLSALGGTSQYRISRVVFYNTTSAQSTVFNATAGSYQLNYTLMVYYSGEQIEGALIMTSTLYESNLFKLVWTCNTQSCPVSGANATFSLVYANNDSRIYKITYT